VIFVSFVVSFFIRENSCNSWTLVFLSSEEQEDNGEYCADEDARGYGEVEGKGFLLRIMSILLILSDFH